MQITEPADLLLRSAPSKYSIGRTGRPATIIHEPGANLAGLSDQAVTVPFSECRGPALGHGRT